MERHQVMTNEGFFMINVTSKRTITRNPPTAVALSPALLPFFAPPPVLPDEAEIPAIDDPSKEIIGK